MLFKENAKRPSASKSKNAVTNPSSGSLDSLPDVGQNEETAIRLQIQTSLHSISGQYKTKSIVELEHSYAKPYNTHPDPIIQALPTKYLFMKDFPRHLPENNNTDEIIDVDSYEEPKKLPFVASKVISSQKIQVDTNDYNHEDLNRSLNYERAFLWSKANNLLNNERISRLTFENDPNYMLLKRIKQEETIQGFREMYSTVTWKISLITWLHHLLLDQLDDDYKTIYIEMLEILKIRLPALVSRFYPSDNKAPTDPLSAMFNHYKLKKLPKKPAFIIVPHEIDNRFSKTPRHKFWLSAFTSMGRLVTISVNPKNTDPLSDVLCRIIIDVGDKIQSLKQQNEHQSIILVGFSYGSIIAASCALNYQKDVTACIFLGFPLENCTKKRGELDDPLLDLAVPCQFIIGENANLSRLDDIENFRESMVRAKTSLVVVGGANDNLVVALMKRRMESICETMVDRCICDEIYSFLENVLSHQSHTHNRSSEYGSKNDFNLYQPKKKYIRKRKSVTKPIQNGIDSTKVPNDMNSIPDDVGGSPTKKSKKKSKKDLSLEKNAALPLDSFGIPNMIPSLKPFPSITVKLPVEIKETSKIESESHISPKKEPAQTVVSADASFTKESSKTDIAITPTTLPVSIPNSTMTSTTTTTTTLSATHENTPPEIHTRHGRNNQTTKIC